MANTRRLTGAIILAILVLGQTAILADEVVFQDGTKMHDVRTVLTETHVIVHMSHGVAEFPRKAIKTINGKALAPAKPVPTMEGTAPAATPALAQAAGPSPSATPDEVIPGMVPEVQQIQDRLRIAPTPQPAQDTTSTASGPAEAAHFPWKADAAIAAVFLLTAIWIYSLQWVRRSLDRRGVSPGPWTNIAIILPIVGSVLYGIYLAALPFLPEAGARWAPWEAMGRLLRERQKAAENPPKRKAARSIEFFDDEHQAIKLKKKDDLSTGLDLASDILEIALEQRASDIHVEPGSDEYRVRLRLDGIMHERFTFALEDGRRIVTAIKSLAQIDISEKRKAQDGRFRARLGDAGVDFRVATANSIHGEKIVIRVLDHSRGIFDLTSLGMSSEMLETFQQVIHSRNGMILATGPTGSGKTSTLYAALRQLDASRINIMTIEDPAEYELAGATQIAVNIKAGVTYESGLRSILRQDPDVILVGEMRDAEAAQVAVSAALTGHLVLSTLHTKDAPGTLSRLKDMGIERYKLGTALLMIIGQRLVRVLCPACRLETPCEGEELASIGFSFDPGTPIFRAQGCPECNNTGFKGRTGLFELLVLDDDLRKAVGDDVDESTFLAMAAERGFASYRQDGALKVLMGITTVEEVLQAI
ncbi:MAG: hypothetical protein BGO12_14635 [Verrucomicrobia bacterium 61-8]|nr:type II/IV secretion system protein [Verrucomicrobiota bacterium]OJV07153.1 MAG: hypothetical protein BGO12_14635 [Verrucomicrobia bacterium 61-8]